MDRFLYEAMLEVDALTPSCPAIAPSIGHAVKYTSQAEIAVYAELQRRGAAATSGIGQAMLDALHDEVTSMASRGWSRDSIRELQRQKNARVR